MTDKELLKELQQEQVNDFYDGAFKGFDKKAAKSKAFWIDKEKKSYKREQVTDKMLENILIDLAEGRGWVSFCTRNRINTIFQEAYDRKVFTPAALFSLHCWAMFQNGLGPKPERHYIEFLATKNL